MVEECNRFMMHEYNTESQNTSSKFSSNYVDIASLQFNIKGESKSLLDKNRRDSNKYTRSSRMQDNQECEKLILKSDDVPQLVNLKNPKLTQWKPKKKLNLQLELDQVLTLPDNYTEQSDEVSSIQGSVSSRSDTKMHIFPFSTHTYPYPCSYCSKSSKQKLKPRISSSFSFGQNCISKQEKQQNKQFLARCFPQMSSTVVSPRGSSGELSSRAYSIALPPMNCSSSCSNLLQENLYQQSSREELLNYIDRKTPRRMSTRDQYLLSDQKNVGSQDPADQLKKQLISMLVSDPEVEKRIKDVVQTEQDVDLATTTTQLDVQVDVSGAYCINQYIMIKTIGQGAIGTVKLCYNTLDKKLYAVKMIDRNQLTQSRMGKVLKKNRMCRQQDKQHNALLREIAILKKLEHYNIVKLHEVIDPPNKSQPVMLVMEYLEEGPVVKQLANKPGYFQKLCEDEAAEYLRMMCNGLDYLHYNRIVHGDLKPDNLLLDKVGELKIADFGCARIMAEDNNLDINNKYGTPSFRAPEMQTGKHYDPFNADIWAMGVCLYIMVFGELPFKGSSEQEIYNNIENQDLIFPEETQISPALKDLLCMILEKNPLKRASLYDIMDHEWVTEFGQIQLISLIQMTRPPSRIEVTETEAVSAINQYSDKLVKMDFEERIFEDGEILLKNGDTTSALFFILSGAVEVWDPIWRQRDSCGRKRSLTVERDTSTMFCQFMDEGEFGREEDGDIYLDSQKTQEVASRLKQNSREDLLLEVKGPANIIGDICICYPAKPYRYNVLARGQVHVLELTQDKLQNALMSLYDQQNKNLVSVLQQFSPNTSVCSTSANPNMSSRFSNVQQKILFFSKPQIYQKSIHL